MRKNFWDMRDEALEWVVGLSIVVALIGVMMMASGCATANNTTRPRIGIYQPKGVDTGQIESRSKAGETSYSMVRFVPRDCQDGEPVPCGEYSTVVVDSRKDSTLAGSFSGVVEITTEHTFIEIKGGEASTTGTGQINAQGEADARRIGAVGEAATGVIESGASRAGGSIVDRVLGDGSGDTGAAAGGGGG